MLVVKNAEFMGFITRDHQSFENDVRPLRIYNEKTSFQWKLVLLKLLK